MGGGTFMGGAADCSVGAGGGGGGKAAGVTRTGMKRCVCPGMDGTRTGGRGSGTGASADAVFGTLDSTEGATAGAGAAAFALGVDGAGEAADAPACGETYGASPINVAR